MTVLIVSTACLWIITILLTAVVFYLARQLSLLFVRVGPVGARALSAGPEIGDRPVRFELTTLDGVLINIPGQRRVKSTLVIFVSPQCPTCDALAPNLRTLARETDSLALVVVAQGDAHLNKGFIRRHKLEGLSYGIDNDIAVRYGITIFPYAVLLNQDGHVLSKGLVNNMAHLESLLNVADTGLQSLADLINR
jgi:methylamine dehydrogenase accessory protein MauD